VINRSDLKVLPQRASHDSGSHGVVPIGATSCPSCLMTTVIRKLGRYDHSRDRPVLSSYRRKARRFYYDYYHKRKRDGKVYRRIGVYHRVFRKEIAVLKLLLQYSVGPIRNRKDRRTVRFLYYRIWTYLFRRLLAPEHNSALWWLERQYWALLSIDNATNAGRPRDQDCRLELVTYLSSPDLQVGHAEKLYRAGLHD